MKQNIAKMIDHTVLKAFSTREDVHHKYSNTYL